MAEHQENNDAMASIVGRTIVAAKYDDPSAAYEWSDHGEFTLTLDDGRTVSFTSTGHDASDVWVEITEAR